MGSAVFSALNEAAAQADGAEDERQCCPPSQGEEGQCCSPSRGGQRKGGPSWQQRRNPQSADEASNVWGTIDTTKVDVGRLAPRILEAQKRIPVQTARPMHRMKCAHDCYVRVLVWDPFRDLLISGGGDGWIRLWATDGYRFEAELDAQLSVRSLLVLTQELASGHSNGEVVLWNLEKQGRPRTQTLKAHREAVYALVMLGSGELVTGAEDIRIFSRSSTSEFQQVNAVAVEVLCMCTVPAFRSGTQVVTGNMNGLITVWATGAKWQPVAHCRGHERSVWAVCFVRDAEHCASGSADQTIRIWDPANWQCKHTLKEHAGWVVGLSCGPGWLLSCSIDQTVRVWDVTSWACERTFDDQSYEVYCVCAFGGGRFATGGAEKSIIVYGDATDAVRQQPRASEVPRRWSQAGSPDRVPEAPWAGWGPARPGHQRPNAEGAGCRERRAQLLAQSDLDMTLGGIQAEVGAKLRLEEAAAAAGGGSGCGSPMALRRRASDTGDRGFMVSRPPQRRSVSPARLQQGAMSVDDTVDLDFDTHQAVPRFRDLDFETHRAVPRTSAASEAQLRVGDQVQVYSASQKGWFRAEVKKVEDGVVTVAYCFPDGSRGTKQLPLGHEHLRPLEEESSNRGSGGVTEWSAAVLSRGGTRPSEVARSTLPAGGDTSDLM